MGQSASYTRTLTFEHKEKTSVYSLRHDTMLLRMQRWN